MTTIQYPESLDDHTYMVYVDDHHEMFKRVMSDISADIRQSAEYNTITNPVYADTIETLRAKFWYEKFDIKILIVDHYFTKAYFKTKEEYIAFIMQWE